MKSLWKDLLFLHGHIAHPNVLEPLAEQPIAPTREAPLVLPPTPAVRFADFDRDAAAHAKGWQQCA